jgi:hypothetical protein
MRAFFCDVCLSPVFFENVRCVSCGHALGFIPETLDVSALEAVGPDHRSLSQSARGKTFRTCSNGRDYGVCNWLVPAEDPLDRCQACRLNAVIPNLQIAGNVGRWQRLEFAKRRLLYTLLALRAPLDAGAAPGSQPLRFEFRADAQDGTRAMTGHANGTITINIAEADDAEREKSRIQMGEPFRTLLGHFRHEVAHYYWDRLIAGSPLRLEEFRARFGDERADYGAALQRHHREGPPPDWPDRFISAYASTHPWEDWAETTAHYLHLIDTTETAASFGLSLQPAHPAAKTMQAIPREVARPPANFDALLSTWQPLTMALNEINRGMGLPDVYPFVISDQARTKLRFVHDTFAAVAGLTTAAEPQQKSA